MTSPARLLSLLTLAAVLAPAPARAQKEPKKDRDLITREELLDADAKSPDLYQAVKRLRPHFFTQNRGPTSTGIQPGGSGTMCNAKIEQNCTPRTMGTVVALPVVYLDGMKMGDPETLKGIVTRNVDEVRYLSPGKAEMEYGLGHEGGAILVKMHQSP